MVPKGSRVRAVKEKRLEERKDRSICVKIHKKVEKPLLEEIIKEIHSGIERVYFPRQKIPRFCFVLCSTPQKKEEVLKAIKKFKNDEVGRLLPKEILIRPPKPKVETESAEHLKTKNSCSFSKEGYIDPSTLVLEGVPKQLSSEEIEKQFPSCKGTYRFNKRRCYLYFKNFEDATKAFGQLKKKPLCGYKISVRYRKVQKPLEESRREKKETSGESESNNNDNSEDVESNESGSDIEEQETQDQSNDADADSDGENNESGSNIEDEQEIQSDNADEN